MWISSTRRRLSRRKGLSRRLAIGRRLRPEVLEKRLLLTTVTGVDPAGGANNAAVSTNVSATFDQNIAAATDQDFVLHSSQRGRLAGAATAVSTSGMVATHDPASDFFPGERVQATVTGTLATAGGAHVWQFRTGVTGGLGVFNDSGQSIGNPASNTRTFGVELGDLDGDGDLDAFMLNFRYQGSEIFLNSGGTFTNSGQSLGPHDSQDVALGDVDGDGDLDAVVANSADQANNVWRNDGNGVFTQLQEFGDQGSQEISLGDLDGDGDLDAFVANGSYQGNRVYLNDGSGMFTGSGSALGADPSLAVDLGDVDGDGDLDAFVASGGTSPAGIDRLFLNDGNGTLTDSGQVFAPGAGAGVELADLDGDGDLDAFVTEFDEFNQVYFNDGSGTFTNSGQNVGDIVPCCESRRSWDVKLGDLDADGDLDAFVANSLLQGNRVYLNDGAGVFSNSGQSLPSEPAGNTYGIAMGDVDGDGDLDVVSANDNNLTNTLSVGRVWLNQNPANSATLGVDNANIAEAAAVATVSVTLSAAAAQTVTVDLSLSGTATENDDYTISGTQITIAAGAMTGSVTITAVQDTVDEPNETVVVDISAVAGATEAGAQQVTVTIQDDDEPIPVPDVTLSVDNAAIAEAAGVATFTANLSVATTVPVTVDLGIAGTAAATDFTASGTQIVIAPGATSGSITITAVQDAIDEADETVVVDIASVANGTEAGVQQQTTTITDDDEPPVPDVTLAVDNATIVEAAGMATFAITLSEATTVPVTVDLGITGTAAASDYTVSATQVVVAAGATSAAITVTAVQDEVDEPDETVIVDITNVTGGNEVGDQQQTTTIVDDDVPPSFVVTSLDATNSGFVVHFNNALDGSDVNLYDTQNAGLGAADVVVTGAASGAIAGSLIVSESAIEFIKSGGRMVADTYTVTLRSAADGFEDIAAMLLDGNGDGTGGDDYVNNWTVAELPAGTRTVSIPDFVRGPGQDVNLPADETTGIPISLSEGADVRAADIRISYDPALLQITGATAPAGGTVVVNTSTPGLAILVYFSTTALPAGPVDFINLQATVPADNASAIYRSQQVLAVSDVVIGDGNDNEFAVVVDDALHLATYFADVSGNGRINASDAAQVARFAALIDTGFAASLTTDPIVVGDISGNGRINAADASRVAQFAALIPVPEIPAVPGGIVITGLAPGLPGPTVDAGRDADVAPAAVDREGNFAVVQQFMSSEPSAIDHGQIDALMAEFDTVESLMDDVLPDVW